MNSYTDPEIIEMLKQIFDIEITKKDTKECRPEFAQQIYSLFLKDFGFPLEKLNQVPFNAPVTMQQYPEMYKSQIFPIQLAKSVQYYLNLIYSNTDFNVMDIFSPEWERTKRFFVLLIEFYNHLSDHLPAFTQIEREVDEKRARLEEIKEQIEVYKQKIKKKEIQNAEAQIELEKVKRTFSTVQEKIRNAQEVKTRYKGRLDGLKAEIQELNTKTKEVELQMLEGKDRIDQLRSQVVDENQTLEYEEGKKKLCLMKETLLEYKNALADMRKTMKLKEEAEEVITKLLIPLVNEYKEDVDKNGAISVELKENNKEVVLHTEKLNDLTRTTQMVLESIHNLETERAQIQKQKDLSVLGLREEVNQLKITLKGMKEQNEEEDIVAADINSETQKVMQEKLLLEQEMEKFNSSLVAILERMKSASLKFFEEDLENLKNGKLQ